ncbi:MAG: sugar-binding protein [Armatimonadota bacterium]
MTRRRFAGIGLGVVTVLALCQAGGAQAQVQQLPWSGADVGKVGLTGSHSVADGVFTIRGAGGGVYIYGDAFYYLYLPLQGDGQITARVVGVRNTSPNTSIGLMARETLEYDSKCGFFFLRPEREFIAAYQARTEDDIESVVTVAKREGVRMPHWLRLARRGDVLQALISEDGNAWEVFGTQQVPMSPFIHIGLFVCSYRTSLLAEATFDEVFFTGTVPPMDRFRQEVASAAAEVHAPPPPDPRLAPLKALAARLARERGTLDFPDRKKLICANQLTPPPGEFVAHLPEHERRPFDGVVLKLNGGVRPFQRQRWDENEFIDDYEALTRLRSHTLTDNFLWLNTSAVMDWFDDEQWEIVLQNTRMMARAAALGQCAGLWVDPEGYGQSPWPYFDAIGREEHSFEEFHAQVMRRGEQWIQAIEEELPAPRLLFAFLVPTNRLTYDLQWPVQRIRDDIPRMRYALLPSFVNGILRGAGPDTVLVEGNEHSYYYRSAEEYRTFARYMDELLPLAFIEEQLRASFDRHVQTGAAVYTNYHLGLHSRTLSRYMTPEEQGRWEEHAVYWALSTADEYAWNWVEGPLNCWKRDDDEGEAPPEHYWAAVRSAREKIARKQELGFEAAPLFEAVRSRAAERRPTATGRRVRPGDAPTIDGRIDEAAWQQVQFLSAFEPMLAWRQDVQMRTVAKLRWDDWALYVAFECQEDRPRGMRAGRDTPDDYFLLQDDNVHILIAEAGAGGRVFRFVVNTLGVGYDALCRENPDSRARKWARFVLDLGYDSDWRAAAHVGAESWTAEAMIPWDDLGMAPVEAGTEVSLNLGRYRTQSKGQRTYWAPVLEMQGDILEQMEPALFGTVVLQ